MTPLAWLVDCGNRIQIRRYYQPDVTVHYMRSGKKKPRLLRPGFGNKSLAIPYFRMANCHTIIGAKRFHFRVRDGFGWFTLAMVTKQTGVVASFSLSLTTVFGVFCTPLEICNVGLLFCLWQFLRINFRLSLSLSSTTPPQTDWVLYGQASRAISTR